MAETISFGPGERTVQADAKQAVNDQCGLLPWKRASRGAQSVSGEQQVEQLHLAAIQELAAARSVVAVWPFAGRGMRMVSSSPVMLRAQQAIVADAANDFGFGLRWPKWPFHSRMKWLYETGMTLTRRKSDILSRGSKARNPFVSSGISVARAGGRRLGFGRAFEVFNA